MTDKPSRIFTFSWDGQQHKVPEFIERKGQDFIAYGADNMYPYYLLDLYRRSAKHNAIVNGKTNYVLGKGWAAENETPQAKAFIDSPTFPNRYDDLNDLTQKSELDLEIYNGFALKVTWDRAGQSIARMEHVEFHKVRANKTETEFIVADWRDEYGNNVIPPRNKWEVLTPFDPNNRKGSQLFYYRVYSPGCRVYPLPEYLGGTAYIELDVEIANFHNSNIKNNFWASAIINFPSGVPSEEEGNEIERQVKRKFSGSDNAGRFIVNFSDGNDNKPEVMRLTPDDLDKQFEILNRTVRDEIFVAHRVVSPMLFGVRTEGQLGGRSEIVEAYDMFKATYIEQRVKQIERQYNYLASFNGVSGLYLQPTEPITEQLSETALLQILTVDELRERAGMEPNGMTTPANPSDKIAPTTPAEVEMTNSVLRSLSGREYQGMMRIVRQFGNGKLNKEQAALMMRQAYGLTEDDINVMLGTDTDPKTEFSSDEEFDAQLFEQVAMQFGSDESEFVTLKSRPVAFHSQGVPMEFEEVLPENKELDTKILAIVKKTKKVEADQIAKETGAPLEKVTERIEYLIGKGKISIINRIATISRESPLPTEDVILETRYKYDLRPGTGGNKILPNGRTRKFCETLIRLNKVYTREDIDQMSAIMGFSVWDRRGGWYTLPGTDLARPSCRHIWQQQLVRRVGNKIQTVES
jgi:hypothetical protein